MLVNQFATRCELTMTDTARTDSMEYVVMNKRCKDKKFTPWFHFYT